ncbi:hypothetical protein MsAg5_15560 [Methanosarcinaceae archaeon Ag5]|uniref:Schlafen AlbA-2 domain-containing protein n=1 Tax=Methanolapillus africanus TaxID=3028297 RepID=A0AAE4MKJ2_9EURY|nr:hypothetical protein [Methanosarcinaceae archaeon Ag5]
MKMKENVTTEFKQEYSEEIKKCVVAFANTSGGVLYVGIDDKGNAIGLKDLDETMLQVSNAVRDSIKPDVTLFTNYEIESIDGVDVVKVTVQKGTASPYYLSGKGIRPEGIFIRQGASNVPATDTAILKMIKETDGEKYEDVRSLNQNLTFSDAEKEFKIRNIPFETTQKKTLKLMNPDGIYTNLGLLLSDQCPFTVKAAYFQGTEKTVFKNRKEFSGSLFRQLNDVYDFIDWYNQTRAEIHGLYRVDNRDYPEEAVREALLNALIHRDYSVSGTHVFVNIYDDRIEVISIGGLATGISQDDILMGVSICRNENLANVFYRLSLIEAYGTGMIKIMKNYGKYTVKPMVEITSNVFKITLPNMNIEAEQKTDAEKKLKKELNVAESAVVYKISTNSKENPKKNILETASSSKNISSFSEHESVVLKQFDKQKLMTRKEVEEVLSLSQPMAAIILRKMVENGKLRKVGSGNKTKYELIQ